MGWCHGDMIGMSIVMGMEDERLIAGEWWGGVALPITMCRVESEGMVVLKSPWV
jgi:hypothetical protein